MAGPLDHTGRVLRARLAAFAMHAVHPIDATTSAGLAAAAKRFLDDVDPERVLPQAERERRADAARRAHMARLAFRSHQARAARKVATAVDVDGAAVEAVSR
jgi:hypothetical protein